MSTEPMIEVTDSCIACKSCVEVCPRYLFTIIDKKAVITNFDSCHDCGHCIAVCPKDAIIHRRMIIDSLENDFPKAEKSDDYNRILAFIRYRRSIRLFTNKKVSDEQIKQLIDLGRYAPTGHNTRKVSYTIIRERFQVEQILNAMIDAFKDIRKKVNSRFWTTLSLIVGKRKTFKLAKRNMYRLERHIDHWDRGIDKVFHNAPSLILIHSEESAATPVEDCSIAAQNIMLGAPSLGLGGTFIGYLIRSWKRSKEIRKLINIPANHGLHACVAIGYPKNKFKRYVPRPEPNITIWKG